MLAARPLGFSDARVVVAHILPNAVGPLVVAATIDFGEVVVYEGMLSFLGLGVPPPLPSWGAMIARGMEDMRSTPMLVVAPVLSTLITILCCNVVGEHLRDRRAFFR